MSADAKEAAFQQDIIDQMVEGGWQLGDAADYDRERGWGWYLFRLVAE